MQVAAYTARMSKTDLIAALKAQAIDVDGADLASRLAAVAAAPENMVDGPDIGLVAPYLDARARKAAGPLLADAVREAAKAADAEVETEQGATRVAALRDLMAALGYAGVVVPMADEFQNEYVPAYARRLAWLSGFKGSAGTVVVLAKKAAIFVDGRYTLQVRDQVDSSVFEPLGHDKVGDWLADNLDQGDRLAYDAWLHTSAGVTALEEACRKAGAVLEAVDENLVDQVWHGQPPKPLSRLVPHPVEFAGEEAADKRARMAADLRRAGADAAIITATDSIAWLLNVRGGDVAHTPLSLAYLALASDGSVDLFVDPRKVEADVRAHLGNQVRLHEPDAFTPHLASLSGQKILADPATCPSAIINILDKAGAEWIKGSDPCQGAKAVKNETELAGIRAAHKRDGAALCRFLEWLETEALALEADELSVAAKLRELRAEGEHFRDLSFPTIAGSGPNGAIVHYKATPQTSRALKEGELLLVDSGAQYLDGTTDVTRTVAIGSPTEEQRERYTLVLKCHVGLARARFPKGTTGNQLDILARKPLWDAGLNFAHGTGHGVGAYLGVHEGPQSISPRPGSVALQPGMIISNEPGYYKAGDYGIRIENLIAVRDTGDVGEDGAPFFEFETLTLAPFDRRLINPAMLGHDEITWINEYHARVLEAHGHLESAWLAHATTPIG